MAQTMRIFRGIATFRTRLKTTATSNCLGVPVRYDPQQRRLVDSRGVWRWKEIVVGPSFFQFPPREQQALLLHEVGHCRLNHVARLLWYIVRSPLRAWSFASCGLRCASQGLADIQFFEAVAVAMPELAAYRMAQEFEADRFAAGCGYGHDLARAFGRISSEGGPFHPHPSQRIARLVGAG